MTRMKRHYQAASALTLALASAAPAQTFTPHFAIPRQALSSALTMFIKQSGAHVVAASRLLQGRQAREVYGDLAPRAALDVMLQGTGLHGEEVEGALVLKPDSEDSESGPTTTEIMVTGTRIRGSGPVGSPLTVIDRAAIEKSGRATVADYIQTLPQNFGGGPNEGAYGTNVRNGAGNNRSYGQSINLRGLGTQSTLVLFDGNRPALGGSNGAFVDTSLIPSTALERIEILTDGASAIYGTDAVAGVVNIRFRNALNGFETRLYSGTAGGDYQQRQFGQAAGRRWSTGGVILAYQYDHHSRLAGSDRAAATSDLRRYGGPNNDSDYSVPGNIVAANGEVFAIPAGQNGRALSASQLTPGTEHLVDQRYYNDLLPMQTTHSVYLAADQQIGWGITAYARALYAHRHRDR